MIRETESLSYMKKALEGKREEEILSTFLSAFDSGIFHSNDLYPEIFLMTYRNDHPFLEEKYRGYLTYDLAMEWMPYNDYRESTEELDKAIDQENFHCYQLHLYLYYSSKEEQELKMIKEFRKLSPSYQTEEGQNRESFLNAVKDTFDQVHKKGYAFLGYELDFTDSQ